MEVMCITDEMEYYKLGKKYIVYRYEKEDDNIWITDDKGGRDCYSEKVFLTCFKWI